MNKRGQAETAIVLIVLAIAVVGTIFVFLPAQKEFSDQSGSFAIGPKEYGGSIAGASKAFGTGRAYELPKQDCYTCSCLKQGITAADRSTAEKVCKDNCGGQITHVTPNEC